MSGWGVFRTEEDGVHVIPIDDCMAHLETAGCACGPELELHRETLVIHHAFDGRAEG